MITTLTDTRPAQLEEWLENLPYTDFAKTTRLLNETLAYQNQQEVKPATRFELLELYLYPYEYLLETWVKNPEKSSLPNARHEFTEPMEQFAKGLLDCCRHAINESLLKKTRWINTAPPTQGMLIGIRLVSHLLLMHYQSYTPVPHAIWRELHELYLSANSLRQLSITVTYPVGEPPLSTTIERAYKQILASSMVDPHHLPAGAIWEIYTQLEKWAEDIEIVPFSRPEDPAGLYMLDISHGTVPYSLSKYKVKEERSGLKIIDCRKLQNRVQACEKSLLNDGTLPSGVSFSSVYANTVIIQLQHAFGTPVKRRHARKPSEGIIRVISGINAVYFYLNGNQEFNTEGNGDDEILGVDNIYAGLTNEGSRYESEDWQFVNESSGGFSIYKGVKPRQPIRIGDLIAMSRNPDEPGAEWRVGTVRWLMIQENDEFKIGVQSLSSNPQTIAIRAMTGNRTETEFRRGLLMNGSTDEASLLVPRGLYHRERSLEFSRLNDARQIKADELLEATVAYERFTWKN